MFVRSALRLRVSPYAIHLMRTKNHPLLKSSKSIAERGRRAAKLYRSLSKVEKSVLNAIADKTKPFKRHAPKCRPSPKPTSYTRFLQKVIPTLKGAARTKFTQAAKLWSKAKKAGKV